MARAQKNSDRPFGAHRAVNASRTLGLHLKPHRNSMDKKVPLVSSNPPFDEEFDAIVVEPPEMESDGTVFMSYAIRTVESETNNKVLKHYGIIDNYVAAL